MAPYSNVGLTSAKYANLRHSRGQCLRLRWRKPRVELALLVVLSMCVVHVRSSEKCSPKYKLDLTFFRMVLLSW